MFISSKGEMSFESNSSKKLSLLMASLILSIRNGNTFFADSRSFKSLVKNPGGEGVRVKENFSKVGSKSFKSGIFHEKWG